jgi:hypothetical protein
MKRYLCGIVLLTAISPVPVFGVPPGDTCCQTGPTTCNGYVDRSQCSGTPYPNRSFACVAGHCQPFGCCVGGLRTCGGGNPATNQADCLQGGGGWRVDSNCSTHGCVQVADCDPVGASCTALPNVPTVSVWGLGALGLLLLSGVALKFGRRRAAA